MISPSAPRAALPFLGFLLLGSLAFPSLSHGQNRIQEAVDCESPEACALRVRYRLFRTEVVRGPEDLRVARIGFGAPPLEEIFSRSHEASLSFERFGKNHNRSSWLRVLGGIEIAAGLVARSLDEEDWAVGLSISGVVIEMAAMLFRTRANEHLSRAIWWYNRSLTLEGVG
jgi:hypothetical protein